MGLLMGYPLVNIHIAIEAMAIEIVDLPMKNGGSFHSYVKLPEGTLITKKKRFLQIDRKQFQSGLAALLSNGRHLTVNKSSNWRYPIILSIQQDMEVSQNRGTPESFILFSDFPWNKPSSYWDIPMTTETQLTDVAHPPGKSEIPAKYPYLSKCCNARLGNNNNHHHHNHHHHRHVKLPEGSRGISHISKTVRPRPWWTAGAITWLTAQDKWYKCSVDSTPILGGFVCIGSGYIKAGSKED